MKKGWETKTIGDVCEFQRGLTYAKGDEVDVSGNVVLRATNIDLATNLLIFDELKYISDKVVVPESKKVKKGSLMICTASGSKSHLGKVAFIDDDYGFAFGGFMGMLTPLNGLLPRYLFHLMTSEDYKDFIGAISDGANINNLTFDNLKRFPVPLPPLPEQQRIVGLLDEAFAGLATAKANAENSLQNARALFESHLQSVFTQRGKGWVEKRLKDVCEKITDGTHHSPQTQFPSRVPGTFPYITSKNIRNNFMDLSKMAYIERAFHDEVYARCKPCLGDVLLTKDGANTGNVTLNTIDEPFSLLSSVCLIKTNQAVLKPDFLCFYLQSSAGLSAILGQMSGAAIKRIVLKDIKMAVIPFPLLKEQNAIAGMLNSLLAGTERLAAIYSRKLVALEALKKSLLNQAFTGEL